MIRYGDWHIAYNPPPIPIRSSDWEYWHHDYDGPGDDRVGTAPSAEAAKTAIDEYEEEG